MNDVCIVIPTHERPAYLRRCIAYYRHFGCRIVICDSSAIAFQEALPANIHYYHWPGKRFADKVAEAARLAGEAFVALAPDDDFLFEGALNKGAAALRSRPALSACVGDVLAYPDTAPFRVLGRCSGRAANADSADARHNIRTYLGAYHQILWSVFRRARLVQCFEAIAHAGFVNENFFELSIATVCAGHGGIYYVDDYWILREVTERAHWGSRHAPISMENVTAMDADVARFRQLCDSALFDGSADLALGAYLSRDAKPARHALIAPVTRLMADTIGRVKDRLFLRVKWESDPRFLPIRKAMTF